MRQLKLKFCYIKLLVQMHAYNNNAYTVLVVYLVDITNSKTVFRDLGKYHSFTNLQIEIVNIKTTSQFI